MILEGFSIALRQILSGNEDWIETEGNCRVVKVDRRVFFESEDR